MRKIFLHHTNNSAMKTTILYYFLYLKKSPSKKSKSGRKIVEKDLPKLSLLFVIVLPLKLNCWAIFRKKYWVSCLADKTTQLHRGRYGKGDHHCWELHCWESRALFCLLRSRVHLEMLTTESWNLPRFSRRLWSCLCHLPGIDDIL